MTAVRPRSAVSHGVGWAGVAGLFGWLWLSRGAPEVAAWLGIDWAGRGVMDGPSSAILSVLACALPMLVWAIVVDKVHRNPSTGIDWSRRRAWSEIADISAVKLVGLWATWALIAFAYLVLRYYWEGNYRWAIGTMATALPWVALLSVPYIVWLDRRLVEPRDALHAFGTAVIGRWREADRRLVAHHLRAWAVKGFFTAFMLSIVPGNFAWLVNVPLDGILADPVRLTAAAIALIFLIDVHLATVGYLLTMRPLDAHIRTANPYAAAWIAALICYPPFLLMTGPLDYHVGTLGWERLFAGSPRWLMAWGLLLIGLTFVYSWATMAFGLRFSNLTHRGIITHGPYALTRHPAYVAKNLTWWVGTLPFVVAGAPLEALRNTALLGVVSGIYYWRAKTEERHLLADPAYRAYYDWAQAHAPIPRLFARVTRSKHAWIKLQPDPRVGPVA